MTGAPVRDSEVIGLLLDVPKRLITTRYISFLEPFHFSMPICSLQTHNMRLVNCQTLQLEEFFSRPIPQYYILSHRWTDDETSYQDFKKGRRKDSKGHKKIIDCCRFIQNRADAEWKGFYEEGGFPMPMPMPNAPSAYVWIDTCCIDKKSSAELSEAINSMYKYYEKAICCYAYLSDVPSCPSDRSTLWLHEALKESPWFDRGWTLQELLAPADVIFLDQEWQVLGHKCAHSLPCTDEDYYRRSGPSLNDIISDITSIAPLYLATPEEIPSASIACRISWASMRSTTRPEDMAYCLLGLLGVNMPLLYGEGEKAFVRLQEELVRRSTDQSVFAWQAHELDERYKGHEPSTSGIFARSPADFEDSGTVQIWHADARPYTITNAGLEMQTVAYRATFSPRGATNPGSAAMNGFIIGLNCIAERYLSFIDLSTEHWDSENAEAEDELDRIPMTIALVEVSESPWDQLRYPGIVPLKWYQRIHDLGANLACSFVTGQPEIVQLYVRTFNEVQRLEGLPWDKSAPTSLLSS